MAKVVVDEAVITGESKPLIVFETPQDKAVSE